MKLKQKLIIIILLVSGIPLILLSIASNLFFSSELKQTINAANFSKSQDIQTKIDGLITSDLRDIKILAKNPDIRSFSLEKAGQLLTETKALHPELSLTLSDGKGMQLVKDNKDKLSSVSSRSFYQQAIKGNEDTISEVLISQATNQPIVVLATTVREKEGGNIVGVLQASMELTKMSDYVKSLSDKNTMVYIVDKEGKVLAHPNAEYVTERKDLSKVQFIQSGLSGKSSSEVITDDAGKKMLVSYNYFDKTGWLICTETLYSSVTAKANNLSIILFAATAVILVIIGFITYFLSASITKPIVRLSGAASQIANGDLNISDIKIKTKDEIGNLAGSFSIMATNLRDIVKKIKDTSNSLLTSSEDLASSTSENTRALSDVVATINEMAQGNSAQSEMISDTSDTIEEISHGISDVSIATEVGANQSVESLKLVEDGQNSIKYQVERMNESDITTKEISTAIGELNSMAQEISAFVVAINSIAEQTNLLALNASIEAARAGEHGKGFSVVAGEIRNLSESSAKAVNEIRGIIEKISLKTGTATEKADNIVQAMQAQKDALNATQTIFNKIKQASGSIADQSQNIAATLNEIKEKTKAVVVKAQEMASITEQSSASMQEVSASSEEQLASLEQIAEFTKSFSNVAKSLIAEVDTFKI